MAAAAHTLHALAAALSVQCLTPKAREGCRAEAKGCRAEAGGPAKPTRGVCGMIKARCIDVWGVCALVTCKM